MNEWEMYMSDREREREDKRPIDTTSHKYPRI